MHRGDVCARSWSVSDVRIDHGTTSGTFSLDGQTYEVDNNVWVVGNDDECVVIDAPHDVAGIRAGSPGGVLAIICTHGHDDHVRVAPQLADAVEAPILLHPDEAIRLGADASGDRAGRAARDGQVIVAGDTKLTVLHTPGHSPGSVCLYAPGLGVVFTGDTLFEGGPGATGRSRP